MKEALLILPSYNHAGRAFQELHYSLFTDLCRAFGGVTVTNGHGGWIAPDGKLISELVTIYMVAGENNVGNRLELIKLAAKYGAEANQQSVYWRGFDGHVHIDTLEELNGRVALHDLPVEERKPERAAFGNATRSRESIKRASAEIASVIIGKEHARQLPDETLAIYVEEANRRATVKHSERVEARRKANHDDIGSSLDDHDDIGSSLDD